MSSTAPAPLIERGEGHIDPAAAFVPVQTRSERTRSNDPADFGTPTGREVNWKHTPIARLRPLFANAPDGGDAASAMDPAVDAAHGVEVGTLRAGQSPRDEVFTAEDVVAAVAAARTENALHIRVPANLEADEPSVVTVTGAGGAVAHAHVVIEAGANSAATVILRHTGSATYAQNVEIIVGEGARLTVISLQEWADDAVHAAAHQARVDRDATLRHIVVSLGGGVVRVNPSVELAGTGSEAQIYGLAFADAGQHLESQVYLHHKGHETRGDVLYKSALQGAAARTVWIGDVLIGPDATGTDSYEANRNLVLTDGARADSIPNLEIETGDIRGAGHASATGRFDDEQLFYLQARGIPEAEARRLVVLGFLSEIVQKTGVPALERELTDAIERELAQGAALSEGAER